MPAQRESWPAGVPRGATAAGVVFTVALVGWKGWGAAGVARDVPMVGLAMRALLALLLAAGALLVVVARGSGLAGLGWRVADPLRGLPIEDLLFPSGGILAAQLLVASAVPGTPPDRGPSPALTLVLLDLLLVATLVPFAEESVFRGLLLGGQLQAWAPDGGRWGTACAVLVNGLLFALAHGPAGGLPALLQHMVVGTGCAALTVRDRSIVRAVVAHGAINATVTVAAWLTPGA
jgi:membrane protease YdiL (CAAX protease family)